jgi:hypothetical protein
MQRKPGNAHASGDRERDAAVNGIETADDHARLDRGEELKQSPCKKCGVSQGIVVLEPGHNAITHDHVMNGRNTILFQRDKKFLIGFRHGLSQIITKKEHVRSIQTITPLTSRVTRVHDVREAITTSLRDQVAQALNKRMIPSHSHYAKFSRMIHISSTKRTRVRLGAE